jgi:drug/metabolite transporter (DMT)-like permease
LNVENKQASVKYKAFVALSMVCFFWGTTWIATKEGITYMPAMQFAGLRQLFGGLLYVIFFIKQFSKLPTGKEWVPILILSMLNFVLTNGLTTLGLNYISPGLGAIIAAIFPLWIVVISLFRTKRAPPTQALVGLILGFAGICIIFYDHLHDFLDADFRLGIILSLVASWTWAFGTLYTKEQAKLFNPYFSIGLQMLISGVVMTLGAELSGHVVPVSEIPWQSWASIAYLAIFGSLISFAAYLYALQHLPTEQASIYAYINPIIAVLSGFLVYGDPLTFNLALGALVILYGVYLVNRVYRKN